MRWSFPFLGLLLFACGSRSDNWQKDLDRCTEQVDSAMVILSDSLNSSDIQEEIRSSKTLFRSLKQAVQHDTLDIDFGLHMDAFVTAYKNALKLETEYTHCTKGAKDLQIQIRALQEDIANNAGDRVAYCEEVGLEKKDASEILAHAKDIQQRFVTLRQSRIEFEPVFEIYRSR